jgi:hypothetical protein
MVSVDGICIWLGNTEFEGITLQVGCVYTCSWTYTAPAQQPPSRSAKACDSSYQK